MSEPLLHVVLYQPEIPPNTGNIGRSCVAVGAKLWLVRPLGFRLEDRYLKRAAMDYWPHLDWEAVDDWSAIETRLAGRRFWLLTKFATRLVWEADFSPGAVMVFGSATNSVPVISACASSNSEDFSPGDVLVFGSETNGLPESLRERYRDTCLKLPMRPEVRSLNLASTANTVMYEAIRQFGGL